MRHTIVISLMVLFLVLFGVACRKSETAGKGDSGVSPESDAGGPDAVLETDAAPDSANPPQPDANVPDAGPSLPACGKGGTDAGLSVTAASPADGQKHVLRMPAIAVTLSQEITCPATSPLTLIGPSGDVPLGELKCDGSPTVLTVYPKQDLVYETDYTLRVEGLKDEDGGVIPECQVTFTIKSKTAAIRTHSGTSLALDEDGTLWTWGDPLSANTEGRTGPADVPEVVDLGGKVVAMAEGDDFSLAATDDGTVWAWGDNLHGQLGRGVSGGDDRSRGKVKLSLPAGVTITDLAASQYHALALRSDGKVMAWGLNDNGELGDGTATERSAPVNVKNLTDVAAVAAGTGSSGHGVSEGGWSLGLKKDGTVWGWGSDAFGSLAQPVSDTDPTFHTPTKTSVTKAKAVAAGLDQGYALLSDGTIRAWGDNLNASLGDGTCHDGPIVTPVTVLGESGPLGKVTAVSAGDRFGLAVQEDGSVWGWGENISGQLGDGTQGATDVFCNQDFSSDDGLQKLPEKIPQISDAKGVAAGSDVSLVLKSDGSVWGAGYNSNDKIGVGGTDAYVLHFTKVPGL